MKTLVPLAASLVVLTAASEAERRLGMAAGGAIRPAASLGAAGAWAFLAVNVTGPGRWAAAAVSALLVFGAFNVGPLSAGEPGLVK